MIDLPTIILNEEGTNFTTEAFQALQSIIATDEANLSQEFCDIPRYLMWWGVAVAQLRARVEQVKTEFDIKMSSWYTQAKNELVAGGGKATVKDIDMAVTAGEDYQTWVMAKNTANKLHGEGVAYLDALRAKKEMAISLGFQKKFEAEMELRNSPLATA